MLKETTQGDALDAIETASEDELRSVQLQRLKWSLQHAYDNVAHYKASFDAAGVHPDDLKQLSDSRSFRSHRSRTCATTIPSACSLCRVDRYRAFTRRAERRASPLSLATPRRTSIRGPTCRPFDPRSGWPRRRHAAQCLWLWTIYGRIGHSLRGGAARLHRRADVRRTDRKAGAIDPRLRAAHHHGHAFVHAQPAR